MNPYNNPLARRRGFMAAAAAESDGTIHPAVAESRQKKA